MKKLEWKKIPTQRFKDGIFLRELRWKGDKKSDQIAALMLYIALIHHVSSDELSMGECNVTYTVLADTTGLSRSKISGGLQLLEEYDLIDRQVRRGATSLYRITGYQCFSGWAKLPWKGLYQAGSDQISAFKEFRLRKKIELNALKLYFLILAHKSRKTGYASINYETIAEQAGIQKNDIRSALTLLITLNLVQVDKKFWGNGDRPHNVYRLCHVDSYRHRGTAQIDPAERIVKRGADVS